MPNWTTNIMTINGPQEEINKLMSHIIGEDGEIDFNTLIPMPEELRDTHAGSDQIMQRGFNLENFSMNENYSINQQSVENHLKDGKTQEEVDAIIAEEKRLIDLYGHTNWYDWSLENWDTKWNADDTFIKEDNTIIFQTAWSAPVKVFDKLFELYPNLQFVIDSEFEGDDTGVRFVSRGEQPGIAYDTVKMLIDENGNKFSNDDVSWDDENDKYILPNGQMLGIEDFCGLDYEYEII